MDTSPTGQFAYCLVISPTGHQASEKCRFLWKLSYNHRRRPRRLMSLVLPLSDNKPKTSKHVNGHNNSSYNTLSTTWQGLIIQTMLTTTKDRITTPKNSNFHYLWYKYIPINKRYWNSDIVSHNISFQCECAWPHFLPGLPVLSIGRRSTFPDLSCSICKLLLRVVIRLFC